MGGETESSVSGWTTDTLAQYLQRQLDDLSRLLDERAQFQRTAMDAALAAADRATNKAEVASSARFDSVNEFRAQLTDQAATFMSRTEAEARLSALAERVTHVEERLNTGAGQDAGAAEAAVMRAAGQRQAVAIVGALVAVVSVAVALILGLNS